MCFWQYSLGSSSATHTTVPTASRGQSSCWQLVMRGHSPEGVEGVSYTSLHSACTLFHHSPVVCPASLHWHRLGILAGVQSASSPLSSSCWTGLRRYSPHSCDRHSECHNCRKGAPESSKIALRIVCWVHCTLCIQCIHTDVFVLYLMLDAAEAIVLIVVSVL